MTILGIEIPLIALVSFVTFLVPVIIVSFNVADFEYLTQDHFTHKTRKLVFTLLIFLLYVVFLIMLDHSYAYETNEQIVEGEIYCYLDLIDSGEIFGDGEIRIIFGIIYILALFYGARRSSKINNLPIRKERMELEKKWIEKYRAVETITRWLNEAYEEFEAISKPYLMVRYRFKRFALSIGEFIKNTLSKVMNFIYDIYRRASEFVGLFGPILVILVFSEMNFYRHLFMMITLIFTIKTISLMVAIHFDDEVNFTLDGVYDKLADVPKIYGKELIWISNSKRHSIYKVAEIDGFVLIHRDNGSIEVAIKQKKFYNRIIKEKRNIEEIKLDFLEVNKKIDELKSSLVNDEG